MVGENIGEAFGGNLGSFRRKNIIVGNVYRPPSFEKVEELVKRLCEWLPREFHYAHDQNFDEAVFEAIVVHIYIAWIHPFEDATEKLPVFWNFICYCGQGFPALHRAFCQIITTTPALNITDNCRMLPKAED
jgi:hypothetical protein